MSSDPHHGFPSGYFKIRNRLSGGCLTPKESTKLSSLILAKPSNDQAQFWYVDAQGSLLNKVSGLALDIKGSNKANGARVVLYPHHGDKDQTWYSDNVGRILSRLNDKALSFDENNRGPGATVYMWEKDNEPVQKWYFEEKPDQETVQLLQEYSGTQGVTKISGERIKPSSEYTYQTWLKLDRFQAGLWKTILYRSHQENSKMRAPGLWIYPNDLKFSPRLHTIKDFNRGCSGDVDYKIPLNTWINIALTVKQDSMSFHVDGKLVTQCRLEQVKTPPRDYQLWVGLNNKYIHLWNLMYSNHALSAEEIQHNMTQGKPQTKVTDPVKTAIDAGVTIARLISNGSHPDCPARRGRLNDYAWCGSKNSKAYYLQLDLDRKYHIKKIMTQGRKDNDQWVTKFSLMWKNEYGKWVSYKGGKQFPGNGDRNTIKSNKVNIITDSLRIQPLAWHRWPSMRVGLDGMASSTVHITQLTSNGSYPEADCSANTGRLNSKGAWCAADKKAGYYLQANLAEKYRITKILTQGRDSNAKQWVTSYTVQYQNDDGDWVKYPGGQLNANSDTTGIISNNVDISTKAVRIYPKSWNNWPSMSLGFDGQPFDQDQCAKYKHLSIQATTEAERQTNLDSYNKKCRKISYYDHLKQLNELKDKYTKAHDLIQTTQETSKQKAKALDDLKKKIDKLNKQIKEARLDVEIEKRRKCPPAMKCLPKVDPVTSKAQKCDINSFDIRTHPEFHKYVKASAVQSCDNVGTLGKACLTHFQNKISDNNIPNMSGGGIGVYEKLCTVTGNKSSKTKDNTEHAYTEDPFDIRKHKDFKAIMKDYIKRSDCPGAKNVKTNTCDPTNIKTHPQYDALMKKYSISTCDGTYKPCPANATELIEAQQKYRELQGDIKKHPQYDALLKKYSYIDNSTCPPTYRPCTDKKCPKPKPPTQEQCSPIIKQVIASGSDEQKRQLMGDITQHPDFKKYVHIDQVKKISQKMLQKNAEKMNTDYGDITKHPQYKKLMEQYATVDRSTCPYTYKPCVPQKDLKNIPISSHPDFDKYVPKKKVKTMVKQIQEAQQKLAAAKRLISQQQATIEQLRNRPISKHPDIDQYMLKSQLPSMVDKECRKHFTK